MLAALPAGVDPDVVDALTAPPGDEHTRPLLESHGSYVVGVFLDGQPLPEEDRIVYREVDVVATPQLVVTVRKTPTSGTPWDPHPLEIAAARHAEVGELLYRLVDDVAASYLDVVVAVDAQIDELEDHLDDLPSDTVRRRVSTLRHDLPARAPNGRSHAGGGAQDRRQAPRHRRRAALPGNGRAHGREHVRDAHRWARSSRSRALSSVRDYHQSVIAERQNDIIKTLTVIASLVFVPTLIVGFYGQNFVPVFDEDYWTLTFSTGLILMSTLVQLALFAGVAGSERCEPEGFEPDLYVGCLAAG